MASITEKEAPTGSQAEPGFFSKERTVAGPGFNRWLVPPAALAIHLCIGMAYGFSVFWLPMSKALGITKPIDCPAGMGLLGQLVTTSCDWKVTTANLTFSIFIVVLGLSAALWGGWLERAGPRKAGIVSALCWCGGLVIGAIGLWTHQLWLIWIGPGLIGGIGLGLGYISPVSTLIKWFPDRRGMATGMAIMGFGGGAMIGAPLANQLMAQFASATSVGVAETFLVLAAVYFVFMLGGALGYRVPPNGWKPAGWTPPAADASKVMVTRGHVHLREAHKTPQFWFIWIVLCMNVSAGIGVLAMASPMLQEVFGGRLIGVDLGFNDLGADQKKAIAAIAAGFTGLLSLFNIAGRFFWASMSDKLGRRITYLIFFTLGIALYASAPNAGHAGSVALFVGAFCIILSMYGGGFATVPAYLADMFGTQFVGAIHGRLLTAWSTAGVIGPLLVNYIRDVQIESGVAKAQAYDTTMYLLSGLLLIGFIANLLVRPVAPKHFMSEQALAEVRRQAHEGSVVVAGDSGDVGTGGLSPVAIAAWLAVGIPLIWGVWQTLQKAAVLFK
ncbi:MAG: OFA family MFS transporter [Nevskia sp.]